MKGAITQEFNNVPFSGELTNGLEPGNIMYWESERLTTEYPLEGKPKGSDRGICKIVNGIITVKFLDKEILSYPNLLEMSGALYGEYAGISGMIQQISFTQEFTPFVTQMYASNGAVAFPQLASYANIAPAIFLRVVFGRRDIYSPGETPIPTLPLKVSITGSLMATALR